MSLGETDAKSQLPTIDSQDGHDEASAPWIHDGNIQVELLKAFPRKQNPARKGSTHIDLATRLS